MNFRPLKLLSVAEAADLYGKSLPAFEPPAEAVPLTAAVGRVLARDVVADVDVPGFHRSTVDGYAVRAIDTFGASESLPALLTVIGEVKMGAPAGLSLAPGQTARIPTGGMLPEGADAVVMLEYAEDLDAQTIAVQRPAAPGDNVLARGEDMAAGGVVMRKGRLLRAQEVGALAGIGRMTVEVYRRPVVAIVSSGDEVIPPDQVPGPGEIRDINAYALSAMVEETGGVPRIIGIVHDDYETLLAAVRGALSERLDATAGGTAGGAARSGPVTPLPGSSRPSDRPG